jgi:hypothetical protein
MNPNIKRTIALIIIMLIATTALWDYNNNNKNEKITTPHSYTIRIKESCDSIDTTISWKDGKTFMSIVGKSQTKEESISKALNLLVNHKNVPLTEDEIMNNSKALHELDNNEFLEAHGITVQDDLSVFESMSIKATDEKGKVIYEASNADDKPLPKSE